MGDPKKKYDRRAIFYLLYYNSEKKKYINEKCLGGGRSHDPERK